MDAFWALVDFFFSLTVPPVAGVATAPFVEVVADKGV